MLEANLLDAFFCLGGTRTFACSHDLIDSDGFTPLLLRLKNASGGESRFVEPKELSKTLVSLTSDAADFVRAQVAAFESIAAIVKAQTEEVTKKFTPSK